jgi:hypothetical protein
MTEPTDEMVVEMWRCIAGDVISMDDIREGLAAVLAIVHSADPHIYLSTGCLHGDHAYCQMEARRYDGSTKTAATCKFCASPCVCLCHPEAS